MITLDGLHFKAFRSFVDATFLNFSRNGLCLINGTNIQTNDASGTGKSSIFLAVAYALNILPEGVIAGNLQSFLTKEKMQVVVNLTDSALGKINVARGKETYIEYGGQKYEGATLVNTHLEKVFGLNSQMLYTLVYRPQSKGSFFLSMNDTEKKQFLTSLLSLDTIEKLVDISEDITKSLSKELQSIITQIASKEEILKKVTLVDNSELIKENAKLKIEISDFQAEKERQEAKYEADMKKDKEINEAIDAKYADLEKKAKEMLHQLKLIDENRKESLEKSAKSHRKSLDEIQGNLLQIQLSKQKLTELIEQADALQNDACPTCNRGWDDADIKLKEITQKIKDEEASIAGERDFLKLAKELEEKLKDSIYVTDKRINQFEVAIAGLPAKANSERPIGNGTGAINMMLQAERKIAALTDTYVKNKAQIDKQQEFGSLHASITKEVELLKSQKTEKEARFQQEADFVKVLGKEGFLGSIFDEVLGEIVQVINNKLSSIANMSTVSFDFKTESLTSKGVVKKSIVPMVSILGHEAKISALSGGMMSSLEIITDLAVKEVIEKRTGKEIGFYFIDEAFNGVGKPSYEACLEILKESSHNRAFYLIDHNTEIKETFNQVIDVEMDKGKSRIK